ncbi:MAG: EamA family transporter [Propionivibrio sp.]|nr:EamA family transporter [Propionivibrio sp.]
MMMRIAPAVFVLLWSTGFIGSRLGASDAEPFTFLSLRFLLVLLILVPILFVVEHRTHTWRERADAMIVGA